MNEVLKSLLENDSIIILLIGIILLILVVVMYLIKIQMSDKKYKDELDEISVEEDNFILNVKNNIEENKEEIKIKESSVEIPKEQLKEKNDIRNIFEEELYNMKTIDRYELDEEESAIISADELGKVTVDRAKTLGVESNQQLIDMYETEQEKKAIISYEELLHTANTGLKINYVEEKKFENGPTIKKVEVIPQDEEERKMQLERFKKEEEFLQLFKEFCLGLK